jgi:hypothetical protein
MVLGDWMKPSSSLAPILLPSSLDREALYCAERISTTSQWVLCTTRPCSPDRRPFGCALPGERYHCHPSCVSGP